MLIGIGFALSAVVNEKMARLSGEASPATFFPIATERKMFVYKSNAEGPK